MFNKHYGPVDSQDYAYHTYWTFPVHWSYTSVRE